MVDRQFLAARKVAATLRRMAPLSLARISHTRSLEQPPRLGLSHPCIVGHYRSSV
jgi:hypothetical protein